MIKKEKIFELKIEEDDEISGIDSISLVDDPAIEIFWVAFSKEKEHEFHIPDNEDDIYLERLLSKGQPEQELLDEGWEIERIETVKENFATSPNAVSSEDNMFYRVRYKYALNSNIRQSPIIATTRQFCKQLINKNYVWRIEEIESEVNSFGQSAQFWRGGFNCRHQWYRIFYKRRGDITNKASASKSKIEVAGFPVELSPEWLQPDTVTSKTAANPSPSTVRNLGLKKQGFEVGVPHYTKDGKLYEGPMHKDASGRLMTGAVHTADSEYLYHIDELVKCKKCGHSWDMQDGGAKPYMCNKCGYDNATEYKMGYDVGALPAYVDEVSGDTISKSLVEPSMFESYNDYPESAKNNACKVLRWRDEHGDEVQGMTQVGWTRANQLCKGENISEETIARMASFARHRENAEVATEFKDTPWKDKGYVAWLGWGGTSGIEWASNKLDSIRNNMSKQYFQISSDEQYKKIVLGPAMIPDQKIFRKDELGNPYYVFFSAETIKMIAEKYMRNKLIDNNDQMHDGKAIKDIHVLESWIKESDNDKSTDYGYGELPVGTWFVSMKVNNDEIWEKVKSKKLNGFSVSGFFSEEAAFSKEEMFLYQVAEILKKY
jgi:hypothetical protein